MFSLCSRTRPCWNRATNGAASPPRRLRSSSTEPTETGDLVGRTLNVASPPVSRSNPSRSRRRPVAETAAPAFRFGAFALTSRAVSARAIASARLRSFFARPERDDRMPVGVEPPRLPFAVARGSAVAGAVPVVEPTERAPLEPEPRSGRLER